MQTDEDERVLAAYLEALEQAQAMDRTGVQRRVAEEFDTERIADRVIATLAGVREFTVSHATNDDCAMGGQTRRL